MNILKLIGWLQLLNWVSIILGTIIFIFFLNSPQWYELIQIGTGIQLILLLLASLIKRKLNTSWFILNLVLLVLIVFMEFQKHSILNLSFFKGDNGFAIVYLFIIISFIIYSLTLKYIIRDLKK